MAHRKTGDGKGGSRRERATANLLDELAALRGVVTDTIDHVRLDLESGLVESVRALRGKDVAGKPRKRPRVRDLEASLKSVRALRVRPKKGRIKDLVRLRDLIDELARRLVGDG